MSANVINSGAPLAGASPSASTLWTASCDNSANLVNDQSDPDIVIPLAGAYGAGSFSIPTWVKQLGQIEEMTLTGTMRGARADTISISLKHETYGVLPLMANHVILGPPTVAYSLPADTKTYLFGESIPSGYYFKSFAGAGTVTNITLPENINPNLYYYYNNYYGESSAYTWQAISFTPQGSTTQKTVPAHRYPYTPDYNYDFLPGNGLITGIIPLVVIYRGFRYIVQSTGNNEAAIVLVKTFDDLVFDNGTSSGYYFSTGQQPYRDFLGQSGNEAVNDPFTESLYTNYGAHDWVVTGYRRAVTSYVVTTGLSFYVATHVVDTYTISFLRWDDITWNITPLAQTVWQAVVPPSAIFQFYPPDYFDFLNYAERSEPLNLDILDWKGLPADGVYNIEYAATSNSPSFSSQLSPNIIPVQVRIDNLVLTIKLKANSDYLSNPIASTTPRAGVLQAYTQGNLRFNDEDRAFIGILCGITGSTTMGVLAGYSVLRSGRTGEIYSVAYSLATVCNINNVNSPRVKSIIQYLLKNWGDLPFSTKGDAGEAFVAGSTAYRIYPVRGQVGLQVQKAGSKLTFQLMNGYPPLVYVDPSVPYIDTFTRISLNA